MFSFDTLWCSILILSGLLGFAAAGAQLALEDQPIRSSPESYSDSGLGGNWVANDFMQGNSWFDIGISRTGQYIAAITGENKVYLSSDYGDSFDQSSRAPEYPTGTNTYYQAVASSGDGKYLLLAVIGGPLYLSADYGSTWNNCTDAPSTTTTQWNDVTVSESGQYMIAVTLGSYTWQSSDYGVTWSKGMFSIANPAIHDNEEGAYFASAISTSGQYQMIVSGTASTPGGHVFYSDDYGATFDPATFKASVAQLPQQWVGVDTIDSGRIVVVANSLVQGGLFISYDYGASFNQITAAPNVTGLAGVQLSGNGSTMAVYTLGIGAGHIFMSYDFGVTWSLSTAPGGDWIDLAMSTSADFILAADYGVALYTYVPNCPAGSVQTGYTDSGFSTCEPCGKGSYTEAFGALTCTECGEGTYSSAVGANGAGTCKDCAYPWDTLGSGDSSCPVVWINMPPLGLLIFLGALLALLVVIFLFGNDNKLVVLIIMAFPALDVLTDLTYLLVSRFYNVAIFVLCVLFFLHPTPMFCYKLYKYRALPYSLRYIWWLGADSSYAANQKQQLQMQGQSSSGVPTAGSTSNSSSAHVPTAGGDHIPFPTILGRRFSLIISFEHHDSLYVVVLEAITWVVAIAAQLLTLVALPAFLLLWLAVGIFLQMTKTIAMGTVWNVWFYVWTGYDFWADEYGTVDTEDLNYGLLSQFCLETIPHIILQSVNNTLLGTWVSDPIAILSLVMSIFMAVATIYKYLYHVGIRADPQVMKDIPLDKSVTLKIIFTKIEYTILNARLEPHSRNIRVPTWEELQYADRRELRNPQDALLGADSREATAPDDDDDDETDSQKSANVLRPSNPTTSLLGNPVRAEESIPSYTPYAPPTAVFASAVAAEETTSPMQARLPSAPVSSEGGPTVPAYALRPSPSPSSGSLLQASPSGASSPAPCPAELLCPLTKRLMTDPVFCADGYTYERSAIAQHFASQQELLAHVGLTDTARVTSPMTKQPLESMQLFPNRAVLAALANYSAALEETQR